MPVAVYAVPPSAESRRLPFIAACPPGFFRRPAFVIGGKCACSERMSFGYGRAPDIHEMPDDVDPRIRIASCESTEGDGLLREPLSRYRR